MYIWRKTIDYIYVIVVDNSVLKEYFFQEFNQKCLKNPYYPLLHLNSSNYPLIYNMHLLIMRLKLQNNNIKYFTSMKTYPVLYMYFSPLISSISKTM